MLPLNQAQASNPGGGGSVLGQLKTQSSTIAVPNGGKLKLPDGGNRLFERGQFRKLKIEARRRMRAIIKSALPLGRKVDNVTPTIVSSYSLSSSVNASQLNASSLKVDPPPITKPMTPPGWQNYYDELRRTASQYGSFPVDPKSFEYRKIVEMLEPFTVLSINKIVNRKVWDDYATKRRQLLKQKSEDPDVWMTLDMTEIEVEGRTKRDKEFRDRNPSLTKSKGKYDLNEALLFHCTRSKNNVEPILKQGLDERLGANNVLMGKGIYFADHPTKSRTYIGDSQTIMLFTVILGDCKDMEHEGEEAKTLTAEPVKKAEEKRNVDDLSFDSITGRPNYPEYNEFVIFDRNQCCPMYEIKLCQKSIDSPVVERAPGHEDFGYFRGETPDFVWKKQEQLPYYIPGWQNDMLKWPFFISTLYEMMDLSSNLELLQELGYKDGAVNEYVLSELDNDFQEAVFFLEDFIHDQLEGKSDEDDDEYQPVTKKCRICPKKTNFKTSKPTTSLSAISYSSLNMKNPIICRCCREKYRSKRCNKLKCNHRVCSKCFRKLHETGTTMEDKISHTWIKCPICHEVDGVEIGDSPEGEMVVERIPGMHCAGHTDVGILEIVYTITHNSLPERRTAYLPDNLKGQKLKELLQVAWDRKLVFTIGDSVSRGLRNVPIWNIEHKTKLTGGEENYGYPDVTYLDRTIKHLQIYGLF